MPPQNREILLEYSADHKPSGDAILIFEGEEGAMQLHDQSGIP
jgi:hypothetical protein